MSSRARPTRRRLLTRSLLTAVLGGTVLTPAACAAQGLGAGETAPIIGSASPTAPEGAAQEEPPAAPQRVLPPLSPDQERDLAFLAAVLRNPANDQETRTGAAERLLAMNAAQAIAVLDEALRGGEAPVMLAVIEAMRNRPEPVGELLDAALDALEEAPGETLDALSIALAKYEDSAFQHVSAMAADRDRPVARRLGPIHALGAFPTRQSGDRLIALADPGQSEAEVVRAAAFASLRRLSGLDFGNEYGEWRRWWIDARDNSPDAWARELVRQYQNRTAELERLNAELARRYVELLRALYRRLSLEEQMGRLPTDLDDELTVVRQFAMERIGRLLRDSERIPEALRQQLVAALDDPSPAVRGRAAELLDELDEPNIAALVAGRLESETDRQVLGAYLAVLANRPTAAALEPILSRLADEENSEAAAEALWKLLRSGESPDPIPETVIPAVREAVAVHRSPGLARLMAYVGQEEDLNGVVPLLDGADAALKTAVAAGLCARQLREPLLERADDEEVYPFAARVLAAGPPTMEDFRLLAALEPAPGVREQWEEAISELAARLPPELLPEADEVLGAIEYAGDGVRASLLEQAVALPPEILTPGQRRDLLVRLTPLLIRQGRALRAFELLSSLNGKLEGELAEAKFRAALHAGRYEAAAQIHGDPSPWVAVLGDLADRDRPAALPLRDEIARRFAGRLAGEVRAAFDAASAKLPAPGPAEGNGESGGDS